MKRIFLRRNLSEIDIVSATVFLLDCQYPGVGTFMYITYFAINTCAKTSGESLNVIVSKLIVSTISAIALIGLGTILTLRLLA